MSLSQPTLSNIIMAMGIGRILIGLAPIFAADSTSKLLGFPAEHNTASTRLMARLFGNRDIGLGLLVFYGLHKLEVLPFVLLFNAFTDGLDLIAISIPLWRREGIDRAAILSGLFALGGACGWLAVLFLLHC